MSNYSRFYFFLAVLLLSSFSEARIHEFETARLKSTAGAGSGSLLLEECAFLNPAPMVFFNSGSFFSQRDSLTSKNNANSQFPSFKNYGFVLAQAEPGLSGTLSYINQREENIYRKRWGVSMAGQMSSVSSLGVSVRDSRDSDYNTGVTSKYYQTVVGITHAISESSSIGVVAYDVFKSHGNETKLIIGLQQSLLEYISGSFDVGADYTADEITKKIIVKGAVQVKLLDDFFVRFGGFSDKIREEKGEGYGISWIQPKLAFEFAIKNTRSRAALNDKSNKEVSISVSLRGL